MNRRRRILFFSESITLAQVVRLSELAKALPVEDYEVHFAAAQFSPMVFRDTAFERWQLDSVDAERLLSGLERGKWLYNKKLLSRYVKEDLRVLEAVQPDVVVGDMRLSLSVSARLKNVPLVTLINAYWSPHAIRDAFPIPDHPIINMVGLERAARYFPQALPHVLNRFAAPVNQLRAANGLPPIGDLLEVLTYGDQVIFPDVPELVPTRRLPESQGFIGPVLWQPEGALPSAWQTQKTKQRVYVTLGSSGRARVLPKVLSALAQLDVEVLLATAQHAPPSELPNNVTQVDYVPGQDAARAADLVITNGGSSTGYQALAEGTPVLGIASNLDQYLAMQGLTHSGTGTLLRCGMLTEADVQQAAQHILASDSMHDRAQRMVRTFARYRFVDRFPAVLRKVSAGLGAPSSSSRAGTERPKRSRGEHTQDGGHDHVVPIVPEEHRVG